MQRAGGAGGQPRAALELLALRRARVWAPSSVWHTVATRRRRPAEIDPADPPKKTVEMLQLLSLAAHSAGAAAAASGVPRAQAPLVGALPLRPLTPLVLDVRCVAPSLRQSFPHTVTDHSSWRRTQSEWDAGHISCAHRLPVQDDPTLIDQACNTCSLATPSPIGN